MMDYTKVAQALVDELENNGDVYAANDGGGFIGTQGVARIAKELEKFATHQNAD